MNMMTKCIMSLLIFANLGSPLKVEWVCYWDCDGHLSFNTLEKFKNLTQKPSGIQFSSNDSCKKIESFYILKGEQVHKAEYTKDEESYINLCKKHELSSCATFNNLIAGSGEKITVIGDKNIHIGFFDEVHTVLSLS